MCTDASQTAHWHLGAHSWVCVDKNGDVTDKYLMTNLPIRFRSWVKSIGTSLVPSENVQTNTNTQLSSTMVLKYYYVNKTGIGSTLFGVHLPVQLSWLQFYCEVTVNSPPIPPFVNIGSKGDQVDTVDSVITTYRQQTDNRSVNPRTEQRVRTVHVL